MTIIEDFASAIINKINSLITTHNNDANAHSGKLNVAQGSSNANKNVVTNASGTITFENKQTIPSASTAVPRADTISGSSGSDTSWSKSDHTHPKSTLYAEATHSHSGYLTSQDITGKLDIAQTSHKGKNLVVDATTGNITFEDKPAIVYNNGSLSNLNIAGLDTVDIIINYEDGTSDTVQFLEFTGGSS